MSLNAATIEYLLEKGLCGADLLEVARRMERRADRTNADRQNRHRAKKSNAVTVTRDGFPNDIDILTFPEPSVVSDETTAPALKPEHVVEAWNATADRLGLPKAQKLTPERRRKLETRIRQNTIDDFTEAIGAIARSPFLRGENDRGWKPNLDWMLNPTNFTKLTEGTYDR